MADPSYLTRGTDPFVEMTCGDLLDFIAFVMGTDKDDLSTEERAVWVLAINQQTALWRIHHKFRLWNVTSKEVTWVADDTKVELEDYFGEFRGNRIYRADEDGNYTLPLYVYTEEEYDREYLPTVGTHPVDSVGAQNAVGIIEQLSSNRQIILRIEPQPSGGDKFLIPFYARTENVTVDGDTIDAPPEVAIGIQFGAAKQIALVRNPAKLDTLVGLEEQARQAIKSPEGRINPRQGRVLPFTGYQDMYGGVAAGQRLTRPAYYRSQGH
jgi:hypothetical protein